MNGRGWGAENRLRMTGYGSKLRGARRRWRATRRLQDLGGRDRDSGRARRCHWRRTSAVPEPGRIIALLLRYTRASARVPRGDRRTAPPTRTKPRSMRHHVPGSGTAATFEPNFPEKRPRSCPDRPVAASRLAYVNDWLAALLRSGSWASERSHSPISSALKSAWIDSVPRLPSATSKGFVPPAELGTSEK